MKKIICLVLSCVILFSLSIAASAASIEITSVEADNNRDVTFTFNATGMTVGESQITVEIYEEDETGNVLSNKIAYVNQFTYDGTNTFTANMLPSFPRSTYVLAVGGTDVDTPATQEFIEYIYGDVVKDGAVNALDIIHLAKYLAKYTGVTLDARAEVTADVTHDGSILSDDLLKIVRYSANYGGVSSLD